MDRRIRAHLPLNELSNKQVNRDRDDHCLGWPLGGRKGAAETRVREGSQRERQTD